MAITFTDLDVPDLNDGADASSYLTASWTPPTSGIIVCFVSSRETASPPANAPTITGNNITWESLDSITWEASGQSRINLHAALAAGATTGQTTLDFTDTQLCCVAHFFQVEGVDLTGTLADVFALTDVGTGTGTGFTTTVFANPNNANNRPIIGHFHNVQETSNDLTDSWTTADNVSGAGPPRSVQAGYRSDGINETTAGWATSSTYGFVAAELKAETAQPAQQRINVVRSTQRW